jgi:hypothetical protein
MGEAIREGPWGPPHRTACKERPFRARPQQAACKTDGVDASGEVLESSLAARQRLGAAHAPADLGPISPELALVDRVLAEQARTLLPDPVEWTRRRRQVPVAPNSPVSERPEAARSPAGLQRRSRWRRTVLLAGLVFAAGAASGGLLDVRRAPLPRVPFEAQDKAGTPKRVTVSTPLPRGRDQGREQHTSAPPARPAANVLGVTAAVGRRGVRLDWQRPVDSDQVAVIRALGTGRSSAIVFRGRGTSYRDVSTRPCTTYRYTIVNYDVRGRRSTGVPTSVVTDGCT